MPPSRDPQKRFADLVARILDRATPQPERQNAVARLHEFLELNPDVDPLAAFRPPPATPQVPLPTWQDVASGLAREFGVALGETLLERTKQKRPGQRT